MFDLSKPARWGKTSLGKSRTFCTMMDKIKAIGLYGSTPREGLVNFECVYATNNHVLPCDMISKTGIVFNGHFIANKEDFYSALESTFTAIDRYSYLRALQSGIYFTKSEVRSYSNSLLRDGTSLIPNVDGVKFYCTADGDFYFCVCEKRISGHDCIVIKPVFFSLFVFSKPLSLDGFLDIVYEGFCEMPNSFKVPKESRRALREDKLSPYRRTIFRWCYKSIITSLDKINGTEDDTDGAHERHIAFKRAFIAGDLEKMNILYPGSGQIKIDLSKVPNKEKFLTSFGTSEYNVLLSDGHLYLEDFCPVETGTKFQKFDSKKTKIDVDYVDKYGSAVSLEVDIPSYLLNVENGFVYLDSMQTLIYYSGEDNGKASMGMSTAFITMCHNSEYGNVIACHAPSTLDPLTGIPDFNGKLTGDIFVSDNDEGNHWGGDISYTHRLLTGRSVRHVLCQTVSDDEYLYLTPLGLPGADRRAFLINKKVGTIKEVIVDVSLRESFSQQYSYEEVITYEH